jgi:hypothetical protein
MTNHIAYHTITSADGQETDTVALAQGALLTDFRGEDWNFEQVTRGPQPGRSAKVLVSQMDGGICREFYASVFPGLEVI